MRAARWLVAVASAALLATAQAQTAEPAAPGAKVLKYAFLVAETGFDVGQISDLYSAIVVAHIFDAPYRYDYLAQPTKIRPNTAAAMPEVSADYRTWTVRLKPGIYFADDPAFKGKKRELVAQDYVYSIKRIFDPANKSPRYSGFSEEKILGIEALREAALKGKPFDYDREIEGLRALDRYTLQFKLENPRPRFIYRLSQSAIAGAVAREVIEAYPGKAMEHPVGTGPFRLTGWRRSSQMVLERNPNFREMLYEAEPAADDAEGQALLKKFAGRRLPMIDRVEISVIEESQPRWLSFVNGEFDLAFGVPLDFTPVAVPNGKLAPNLAKRGIQVYQSLMPDRVMVYFNMDDPLVGGYTPEKVALRRAVSLAMDMQREISLIRKGQAIPAQSIVAPHTYGYDPDYRSENSAFDPARAKALLDMYGYIDRDGDGWREQPDGKPMVIEYATTPDSQGRQFDEAWLKNLSNVGLRTVFKVAKWPEQLKKARSAQLMVWQVGQSSEAPDVQDAFEMMYGPSSGNQNLARFKLPAFDALYERMQALPDGPERLEATTQANKLLTAYMPQRYTVHRVLTDLAYPWVIGYRRPAFGNQWWHFVDIDNSKRPSP
ncbi:MAG TPA: ABC transporter substrate-binding protein [Rhizobacter sp.]|nr:ABC transporter substrate-binding protein [Rhizobacter sp.]